jgi:LuxR family transcriptional regulator, maltose regulon positive regulatory protein
MSKDIPILFSKLMAPRISDTIFRDKLGPIMQEITEKKITVVTAGAGYGKTTLIAQAVQEHDTVWYRLDSLDRDFPTFLYHLVEGVRRVYPGFGRETTRRLEQGETLTLEYRGVAALFIHELGSVLHKDLMIVLDDYHMVHDSPMIRDTVQLLAENLCPYVHLIIMGRSETSLQLSKLRIMREVLDVSQDDLLFSSGEISHFFRQIFNVSLTKGSLEELQAKTSGWVSALILFFHSVREKDALDIEQEIHKLKGSGRLISDYLAENVYALLQAEMKSFLLRTSILSRLNALFCNRLLKISNAAKILGRLQKSHLFTFVLDEEGQEYCYHKLFQEYLQAALMREMGSEEKVRLHLEAGRILEEGGEDEEAVRHYLMAGAYGQACAILERIALALIGSGRHELMNVFLEKIPEPFFQAYPWIEYLRGFANISLARYLEARGCFIKALVSFKEKKDQTGVDRCLDFMATALYLKGDFHSSKKIFAELLQSPALNPALKVEVLIHLVFITAQSGRMEESDRYYEQALMSLPAIGELDAREISHATLQLYHGFRHVFSGNMFKAIDLAQAAKEKLQRFQSDRFLIIGYQLTSMAYSYLGLFAKGFEEAWKGLSISKEKGFRDFSYGWILCNAGVSAAGLGKTDEARLYAEDALRHFQELGSYFGEACAYLSLGSISLHSGRPDLAESMAGACLNALGGSDLPYLSGPAKGIQAYVLAQKGQLEKAEKLLQEAHSEFSYSTYFDCVVLELSACIHWHRGRVDDALESLHQCLRIAEAHRYEGMVALDWAWKMLPLVMLYSKGAMQGCIRKIFSIAGGNAASGLIELQKQVDQQMGQGVQQILNSLPASPHPGLKVHCLGRFQVFKGQEEIPAESWKSSKSKMLFKLLLHYRGRGFVGKDVFIEHLWPEDDPAKTSTRFHVALTTLRRILEPGLKRGLSSAYLKSDGDTYLLDLGENGFVDVEVFEEACSKARAGHDAARTADHLFEAEGLYQGDFLSEDPYEPWCTEERDRIKALYFSILSGIIDYFFSKKEYAKAIDYCSKYLAIDAYAENIYQHLMRLYALFGNNSMVHKTYERCRDMLVADLGCPLSRKTESLVKELIGVGPR